MTLSKLGWIKKLRDNNGKSYGFIAHCKLNDKDYIKLFK